MEERENQAGCEAEEVLADLRTAARQAEMDLWRKLGAHVHGVRGEDWRSLRLAAENFSVQVGRLLDAQRRASQALAGSPPVELRTPAPPAQFGPRERKGG